MSLSLHFGDVCQMSVYPRTCLAIPPAAKYPGTTANSSDASTNTPPPKIHSQNRQMSLHIPYLRKFRAVCVSAEISISSLPEFGST